MRTIALLLVPVLLLGLASPAFADVGFDAFWAKFKTAVGKKDKDVVASMTKLPYLFDSKQLNKAQFIAKYDALFPKSVVKCFAKAKPSVDRGSYFVFCGESIYFFNKEKDKWLFTEIGVND
ncbi:MAG: hypothetical protein K2X93_16300 [Candidatus Obscuribacterales bacterium]|nr:hypothetical protein [Candidatus Obscuribacterales bacterium]